MIDSAGMGQGHADSHGSVTDLYGLERDALAELAQLYSTPAFHGRQIYRWLYERGVHDPTQWTDLPLALRERLRQETRTMPARIADRAEARDGTIKYRVELADGASVETVYMTQSERVTLCISSQVGCALDCKFCLTGRMGLVRHLTVGEILAQVALVRADRDLHDRRFRIVFMGMGEPLHNYDGVMGACRILHDEQGFGMSRHRITVSTSGMVPAIEKLAREPVLPRLAISLNATTDEVRGRIMPINRKYPIAKLLDACRAFVRETGERFTFEYVLLEGINAGDEDIRRLAGIAGSTRSKINLIPFNPVPGWLDYQPPTRERVLAIRDRLLDLGQRVSIRWSRGADARAACGQLALLPGNPPGAPVGDETP